MTERIQMDNRQILYAMSMYLNKTPDFITGKIMHDLCLEYDLSPEEAFSLLLASATGLQIAEKDTDFTIYQRYFPHMIHRLDPADYRNNPYLQHVHIPQKHYENWTFCQKSYKPYEAFVFDDLKTLPDGRIIPQIGFFEESFSYPCVMENGREWMLITPNEIHTMASSIQYAHGRVLTYGLGLGYFAFMAGMRNEVSSITVIERDAHVISLFRTFLLPQFPCREKITLIEADAFQYAETEAAQSGFDYVFSDIWHDPSDGLEAYQRLKACEKYLPNADFSYWIEPTLRIYLRGL